MNTVRIESADLTPVRIHMSYGEAEDQVFDALDTGFNFRGLADGVYLPAKAFHAWLSDQCNYPDFTVAKIGPGVYSVTRPDDGEVVYEATKIDGRTWYYVGNQGFVYADDPASQEAKTAYREKEPEPSSMLDEAPILPPKPVQQVIVVGSFDWDNRGAVTDALWGWFQQHGGPDTIDVTLVTSGAPGAEQFAREFAAGLGWQVEQVRDEALPQLMNAIAFGFIRNRSAGATAVLDTLHNRIWVRVYTDDTRRVLSPWTNR